MNLPNKLSTLRICLVPIFVAVYFLPFWWSAFIAVGLFALAAFTDFLDGHIARKYNLVTDLGKLLDPIADKILVCAALFCVVATNPLTYGDIMGLSDIAAAAYVPQWSATFGRIFLAVVGVIILARELLISAVRQIAASKGVVVQANVYGKVKTIFQDISLPVLIAMNATTMIAPSELASGNCKNLYLAGWWTGVALLSVATVLTIVSCVIYLVQNRKVFNVK